MELMASRADAYVAQLFAMTFAHVDDFASADAVAFTVVRRALPSIASARDERRNRMDATPVCAASRNVSPRCRLMLVLLLFAMQAQAVVVDSGPVAIALPATAAGLQLNLVTGSTGASGSDLRIVADGSGRLSLMAGTGAAVLARDGAAAPLDETLSVAPAGTYATSGTLPSGRLLTGGVHYVGLRFVDEASGATRYGYAQLRTTAPTGYPATILRHAYETAGTAITVAGDSRLFGDGMETFVAATCEEAAVREQAALATSGSTVFIPAGDCNWSDRQVSFAPGVHVRGAGRDRTILRRGLRMADAFNGLLRLRCGTGTAGSVADLALVGNAIEDDLDNGIWVDGTCVDFTIRDIRAAGFSNAGIHVRGYGQRGVIYRSDLIANYRCAGGCYGYGVVVYGGVAPNGGPPMPPLALGTRDAVYVEDSYFADNRHSIASNQGSRYVFRHNTALTTARTRNFGMLDAHGAEDTDEHGSRSYEIYANYLRVDTSAMQTSETIVLRGGDGVVYDNVMPWSPYETRLLNEVCTGSYPLHDQIMAAYIWNNTFTPRPDLYSAPYQSEPVWVDPACAAYLVEGRNYFRYPKSGYSPYAYPHPLR